MTEQSPYATTSSRGIRVIRVTCAIIVKDGKVLAALRGAGMGRGGLWEFPGGKVRDGEGDEACLIREIQEELGLTVRPSARLGENAHDYGDSPAINLVPFVCEIQSGELRPTEHAECRWCARDDLGKLDWCDADLPIVEQVVGGWDALVAGSWG
jgi:8-oxo-dGTP diphosphatase